MDSNPTLGCDRDLERDLDPHFVFLDLDLDLERFLGDCGRFLFLEWIYFLELERRGDRDLEWGAEILRAPFFIFGD